MSISKKETNIPIRRQGDRRLRDEHDQARVEAPPVPANREAQEPERVQASPPADVMTRPDVDWRETALRLTADMDNYRKRQTRWAEDEVRREKADLLRKFLDAVDNLEVALQHIERGDPAHQGVQVAYDSLLKLLLHEGVERIFAKGAVFDPHRHEAVAMVPAARGQGGGELRVVDVTSPGYLFGERILRPAKVIVAKPEA